MYIKIVTALGEVVKFLWELISLATHILFCYAEAICRVIIPPRRKSLVGKVILITGGASGIGRELVLTLGKNEGAKVISWDLDVPGNKKLIRELRSEGCEAYGWTVDVSNRLQVEAAAKGVQKTVGDVSILINNAGIMPVKRFLDHSPAELEAVFGTNVLAHVWTLRSFLPKMMENREGHIVSLCSFVGFAAQRYCVPYSASKYAVRGLVEGLMDEIKGPDDGSLNDLHFTTVYPFSTNTRIWKEGSRLVTRFPSLVNNLEPAQVAERIVDGIRGNVEHVYIPRLAQAGILQ